MTQTTLSPDRTATDPATRLRRTFAGRVHRPGERGYDVERRPLHPTFDPLPVLVAEASGPTDVRAAVEFAREEDLPIAVQATGHGTHQPSDGGLLIKTGRMATVFVDPQRRVARVGPGARWSDVIAAAAPYGLAPLSGSAPSVGVVGYTVGGGLSWLSRTYGFAADSVISADVVTGDGRLVTATADRHADLFWAIRGGGGNFGIVTALEFRLHPVAEVYAGTSYFPVERAADVIEHYRDWVHTVPDELSSAVVLTAMPDTAERAIALKIMYAGGDAESAERLLRPLRDVAGPALVDGFRTTTYAAASMGGTPPIHLDRFDTLPDPVVRAVVNAAGASAAPGMAIEIRHWGGAMSRPAADAGPVGHRGTPFSVIVGAPDPDLAATLREHATGGSFLNFLGDTTRTETAYDPDDYRRLRGIKQVYDPEHSFRFGHGIPPARRGR